MGPVEVSYDRIGAGYDTTRRADTHITEWLCRFLDVNSAGVYLDIACGTGNYTVALAAIAGRWHGLDASITMIQAARPKSASVSWHVADVTDLPSSVPAVDGVSCVMALHHLPDVPAALREVRRVLRPGGRFVAFTASREQMRSYWLNAYFPVAMARAIAQMPDVVDLQRWLSDSGLSPVFREPYTVEPDLQDLFLYSGKRRPHLYLDARVRAGISTFAALADQAEVERGCRLLAEDLRTGRFRKVAEGHDCGQGDYLFVVAGGEA
jgi:ubiquinone/menaquinone biosynthesis C-methylase UbiE